MPEHTELEQQPRRGGRKSRGPRVHITARVEEDRKHVYEQAAKDRGLHISEYVEVLLAQASELPVPDYIANKVARHQRQGRGIAAGQDGDVAQELPIGA